MRYISQPTGCPTLYGLDRDGLEKSHASPYQPSAVLAPVRIQMMPLQAFIARTSPVNSAGRTIIVAFHTINTCPAG